MTVQSSDYEPRRIAAHAPASRALPGNTGGRGSALVAAVTFLLVLGSWSPCAASAATQTCWVVGIAMNNEKPELINAWNDYGIEFTKVFSENSGTLWERVKTRTVLGSDVTRENVLQALTWLSRNARSGDLVAFYVTSHGGTERRNGWSFGTFDDKVVSGTEIKEVLAKLPCQVLCVIDSCESGGFARSHKDDVPLPPNCTAVCSSRARHGTTNRLNEALHEALWGNADEDRNGFVELGEMISYVRSRTKAGLEGADTKDGEIPVIVRGEGMPENMRLVTRSDKLVAMAQGKQWYLGRVLSESGDTCTVHVMGWSDDPESDYFLFNQIAKNRVCKVGPGFPKPVLVNENGIVKPALLQGNEDNKVKVRFFSKRNPEKLVERDQVTYPFFQTDEEHTRSHPRKQAP